MSVTKQIDVIVSAQDDYSGTLDNVITSLTGIGIAALAAEASIVTLASAATLIPMRIGREFFDTAVDYHDAMLDIHAVAQSVGTSQQDISDVLDQMVISWPLTGRAAGQALETIAQRGFGARAELQVMGNETERLALATSVDLQTAVNAILTVMNQYGFNLSEVGRVANVMAASQFNSAASVDLFSIAMRHAGPIANMAGIEFEELAGVMASLADEGLEFSQVGTILRMAIAQLMRETDAGTAALARYGLSYDDVNPSVVGLTGVVRAFGGQIIEPSDAIDIFGVRAALFASVINRGAGELEGFITSITGTNAAVDAANAKMAQWSNVLNMVEGDVDNLKNQFGQGLVQAVVDVVGRTEEEGIRGIITEVNHLEREFGTVSRMMLDTFNFIVGLGTDLFGRTFGDAEGIYSAFVRIMDLLTTNVRVLGIWATEFADALFDSLSSTTAINTGLRVMNTLALAILSPIALIHDAWVGIMHNVVNSNARYTEMASIIVSRVLPPFLSILEWGNRFLGLGLDDEIAEWRAATERWRDTINDALDESKPNYWSDNVQRAYDRANAEISRIGTAQERYNQSLDQAVVYTGRISPLWVQIGTDSNTALVNIEQRLSGIENVFTNVNQDATEFSTSFDGVGVRIDQMEEGFRETQAAIDFMNIKGNETEETMEAIVDDINGFVPAQVAANREAARFTETIDEAGVLVLGWKGNIEDGAAATADAKDAATDLKDELSEIERFELQMELEEFRQSAETARTIIETTAATIQTQIEWRARLDIAEVEAAADIAVATFENIGASVAAVSAAVGSMFAAMAASNVSAARWSDLRSLLRREMDIQETLVNSQVELNDIQADIMRERLRAMQDAGGITYNIGVAVEGDVDGWLTGLVQSLMTEIMVKATAEDFHCMCEV